MNVFFDTNVLIDVLFEREPFAKHAIELWSFAEKHDFNGYISTLSHANVHYLVRKYQGSEKALDAVKTLQGIFHTVAFDEHILKQATHKPFKDFEDAIQLYSAVRVNAHAIVTRNLKHFPTGVIPIHTPTNFLKTLASLRS